ncbi:MAG: dinitrogenase iron-molybdenum cofactor biosynthesis protein [Clostridium sp.]|nr:dinitrogenase iron-molybdenum cofactor biosynthesis protein [Clostridium sp.]
MSYRVAFVSTDGKVVNAHFGKATKFHIVEVNDSDYKYIESRDNIPACNNFEHSEGSMQAAINNINDCKAVFALKIGRGASITLKENNIEPIEAPYFITDILEKLIKSKVKLF